MFRGSEVYESYGKDSLINLPQVAAMCADTQVKSPERPLDDIHKHWWGLGRLDPVAMAAAGAVVGAVILAVLTIGLLLQEPAPGQEVGANLKVLGAYLPGYEVSWFGACISASYGFVVGVVTGFVIAILWNVFHLLIIRWLLFQRLISGM